MRAEIQSTDVMYMHIQLYKTDVCMTMRRLITCSLRRPSTHSDVRQFCLTLIQLHMWR